MCLCVSTELSRLIFLAVPPALRQGRTLSSKQNTPCLKSSALYLANDLLSLKCSRSDVQPSDMGFAVATSAHFYQPLQCTVLLFFPRVARLAPMPLSWWPAPGRRYGVIPCFPNPFPGAPFTGKDVSKAPNPPLLLVRRNNVYNALCRAFAGCLVSKELLTSCWIWRGG